MKYIKSKNLAVVFMLAILFLSCKANSEKKGQNDVLSFDIKNYKFETLDYNGQILKVRAYENIPYVTNPVDTVYQKMNIYIPEAYFKGESINGYTSENAPVFYPNYVGGYMPAQPGTFIPSKQGMMLAPPNGQMPVEDKNIESSKKEIKAVMHHPKMPNTIAFMISKGYVVASAGARGRTLQKEDGTYTGKAPAALVDLKAGIRYLKYNDSRMPGDANKIISNGTSAGGAMSTLLGATGNSSDYESYLKELGAADATDDIFAVSAYCPITNLENADAAYEWQFNGVNEFTKHSFGPTPAKSENLTDKQIGLSDKLKSAFIDYLNSLNLKDNNGVVLSLDANGDGTFKNLVMDYVMKSARLQLDSGKNLTTQSSWLTIKNNKAVSMDWDKYVHYMHRQKTPPAFDALDLTSAETDEFGDEHVKAKHFTTLAMDNSEVADAQMADAQIIKMMNPMFYLGQNGVSNSKHWRIRHGTQDKDTGLAVSVILATRLENLGIDTNFLLPWERPHSGDYDLAQLADWIDSICK